MQSLSKPYQLFFSSTLSLLIAWLLWTAYTWLSLKTGAMLSGFQGEILWSDGTFTAASSHWNRSQVIELFLLPYLLAWALLALLQGMFSHYRTWNKFGILLYGWLYALLIVQVLFMPLLNIHHHTALHHPFNWLGIPYLLQLLYGYISLLAFIFAMFRPARIFGSALAAFYKENTIHYTPSIPLALLFLPLLTLTAALLTLFPTSRLQPEIWFLPGLLSITLATTWLLKKYHIII